MKNYFALILFLLGTSLNSSGYHTGVGSPSSAHSEFTPSTGHHPSDVIAYHDMDLDCDGEDTEIIRSTGEENWTVLNPANFSGGATVTISKCGNYALSDCIKAGSTDDTLIITGTNITLDMSGHGMEGLLASGASAPKARGITIFGRNITVRNGFLSNFKDVPISIKSGSSNVRIENITILEPAQNIDSLVVTTTLGNIFLKNITISNDNADSRPTGHGINVTAATQGLTLDGFAIEGLHDFSSPSTNGITIAALSRNIIIRNGTITNITGSSGSGIEFGTQCKGIVIENVDMSNLNQSGIECGKRNEGITINNCTFTTIDEPSIHLFSGCSGVSIKNIVSHSEESMIQMSSNCSGISVDTFVCSSERESINIDSATNNIKIKNGIIKTINDPDGTLATAEAINIASSCWGIEFDNINVSGGPSGLHCDNLDPSTPIYDVIIKNSFFSGFTGTNAFGIKCRNTNNVVIENCLITTCTNYTAGSNVQGVFLSTCTGVKCTNVQSNGHAGDGAQGFRLLNVNGGQFENCTSLSNYAQDTTDTYTCAGFLVVTSTGITFTNCESSAHMAKREAMGFLMANAIGCEFESCTSLRITQSSTYHQGHPRFAGFYSLNGVGNSWSKCTSNQHWAGSGAARDGSGAIGYYLSNESQSTLEECVAKGNGGRYNHTCNAIGFYLDDTERAIVNGTAMAKGDCQYCVISNCSAKGNVTSATTGVAGTQSTYTAYGFRDDSDDTRNVMISNMAIGNTDSSASRITTNYWMDLAVGGTTPATWPLVSATMDGLSALNDPSTYYNVGITA
jgi:hypothetical protein